MNRRVPGIRVVIAPGLLVVVEVQTPVQSSIVESILPGLLTYTLGPRLGMPLATAKPLAIVGADHLARAAAPGRPGRDKVTRAP